MSEPAYPYATGDLLVEPNTYFYTSFAGHPFIEAWKKDRAATAAQLPSPENPPPADDPGPPDRTGPIRTERLLEHLYARVAGEAPLEIKDETACWLTRVLAKFEVTKRLRETYDENLRALERTDYRNLGLYVRFGEVMDAAYDASGDLRYLNALLKCLDTLCACRQDLTSGQQARLSRLVCRELDNVRRLGATVKVEF